MKPFEGIRVLDLTHVLAGPFATHQLAVLGADVIKIEPPDRPDMTRHEGVVPELNAALMGTQFLAQNGGKRAITLDLKSDGGKAAMRRLIAGADVLVQNYAGDALERLGFGPDAAAEINPRLIYCTMTGFGRTGDKAGHAAFDTVIQAFSGLMAGNVEHPNGPQRVGPPMVDYGTGAQAALAISAAIHQRARTGKGQVIDVSMLDSAMMLMSVLVTECLASGNPPVPHGNAHPKYAGYRTYDTADGLLMIGCFTNGQLARLLDLLGETARAEDVRQTPRTAIAVTREADTALIQRHLTGQSAADWEARMNMARIPAARVRTLDETLAEAQVASRGVLQPVAKPEGGAGPGHLPVAGYSYAHGSPGLDRPPPRFGEHTEEVLAELGFSVAEIETLLASRET